MIDKESCAGDLRVPNLPQVDDGNTVGDAALRLLAIASFIIRYRREMAGTTRLELATSAVTEQFCGKVGFDNCLVEQ